MFAKVFGQIFDSSVAEDYLVRLVFEDFLVLADKLGVVDMTPQAVSRRTNVPLEIVQRGILVLSSPDPESRSQGEEGRRLIPIDSHRSWGWQIVNYEHYRNLRDEEARRAYFRDAKREYRSKKYADCPPASNVVKDSPTNSTQAEADTEAEQKHSRAKAARGKKTEAAKSRHAEFKAAILRYWESKNPGVEMPWGPAEGRNLEMWLRETPNTTLEQFVGYLRNRFKSAVTHTERPSRWIGNVTNFAGGPIDKYGKPLQESANVGSGKNQQSPASQRVEANLRAVAETAVRRGWVSADNFERPDAEAVAEPGPGGINR